MKLRIRNLPLPEDEDKPLIKRLIWAGIGASLVAFFNVLTSYLHSQELDFAIIIFTYGLHGIIGPLTVIDLNKKMRAKFYKF